jgi:glycerol-3-phosphate acyltransferase PlsY
MTIGIALLAAAVGYLFGSISWARIITRFVAPGTDISEIREPVPHSDEVFVSDSVSATAVRIHVSTRYGCLTAILDMLKVALPTLAFKLWLPDTPYFLLVAAMGVVGHDWPLFFKFKGGRGESPILGGLIVIDFVGLFVTNVVGFALGVLIGNILVLRWAGLVLLIPWMWLRFHDPAYVVYMVFVNVVYWVAMAPDLKQYFQFKDAAIDPTQEELAGFLGMGERLGRLLDRYSLPALWSRLRGRRAASP